MITHTLYVYTVYIECSHLEADQHWLEYRTSLFKTGWNTCFGSRFWTPLFRLHVRTCTIEIDLPAYRVTAVTYSINGVLNCLLTPPVQVWSCIAQRCVTCRKTSSCQWWPRHYTPPTRPALGHSVPWHPSWTGTCTFSYTRSYWKNSMRCNNYALNLLEWELFTRLHMSVGTRITPLPSSTSRGPFRCCRLSVYTCILSQGVLIIIFCSVQCYHAHAHVVIFQYYSDIEDFLLSLRSFLHWLNPLWYDITYRSYLLQTLFHYKRSIV